MYYFSFLFIKSKYKHSDIDKCIDLKNIEHHKYNKWYLLY